MRPWLHVLGIAGGIAATAGFEGWTTSSHGPRSSAHYASVENASMTPKEVALGFERLAFSEHHPQEAVDRLIGAKFVDHEVNQVRPGDRESYLQRLTSATAEATAVRTIEHVVAEGDVVVVHYLQRDSQGSATGVDLYRIADRKIIEHWSVTQPQNTPGRAVGS
jgi:predicted SnoaL-like aldol condensation-catalyzing enzyme